VTTLITSMMLAVILNSFDFSVRAVRTGILHLPFIVVTYADESFRTEVEASILPMVRGLGGIWPARILWMNGGPGPA
jgi:hypothetical protein